MSYEWKKLHFGTNKQWLTFSVIFIQMCEVFSLPLPVDRNVHFNRISHTCTETSVHKFARFWAKQTIYPSAESKWKYFTLFCIWYDIYSVGTRIKLTDICWMQQWIKMEKRTKMIVCILEVSGMKMKWTSTLGLVEILWL